MNQEIGTHIPEMKAEEDDSKKAPSSPSNLSKSSAMSKFTSCGHANPESSESYLSLSEASNRSQDTSPRSSMDNALKSEKAFIEYVMSLSTVPLSQKDTPQSSKFQTSPSTKAKHKSCSVVSVTSSATKVGLDHLDNLCKLMEQLSELKETNTKLQKRVQYLEDLKTLHEMHKEIRREVQYGSENVLSQRRQHMCLKKSLTSTDYAKESPRGSKDYVSCLPRGSADYFTQDPTLVRNSRSPSGRRSRINNRFQYDMLRRERSKSVGYEEVYDSKSKRIFPKWSKVKEALGWESERKETVKTGKFNNYSNTAKTSNEDTYFTENRRILTDNDIAALRIPIYSEYCEKDYVCPTDSYAGEAMATCGDTCAAPFNSSAEDINRFLDGFYTGKSGRKRDSVSSDKRFSLLDPPAETLKRHKSTPSPGSEKVQVSARMLELKPKSLTIERDMDAEQAFAKFEKEDAKKAHKSPWGRVKTIIEKRKDSLKRRTMRRVPELATPATRSQDLSHIADAEDQTETFCRYDFRRKSSDDQLLPNSIISKVESRQYGELDKVCKRKKQVTVDEGKDDDRDRTKKVSSPLLHTNPIDHFDPLDNKMMAQTSDREVGFRTPGSSPQFHRKSTWMKMKNVLRSKKEEGVPTNSSQSMPSSPNGAYDGHFDFEDSEILGETPEELECYEDDHEITRVGSDSYVNKFASSAPVSDIMLELQRNISEDFTRKMEEWERIRNSGMRPTTSPKWERKNSSSKARKKCEKQKTERYEKSSKPKVKDLTWLEKELQKIEKEKQRLSREKEKYEERAVRLERLRQTVLTAKNSNKKEVLVRTSAGEFRFEGISDAFTKKLYEWETKRGVGPELSTIALLDSSLGPNKNSLITIQQTDKAGNLHRGLSRSESSIAEIGQHSHTSSNSLPSLKPATVECVELTGIHQHSRANSEPDLFSYMSKPNNNNQNRLSKQNNSGSENTTENRSGDLGDSYAHPEVTQLIDSDADETMCDEDGRQEQRDENYYSLLEENVILLEQLKTKEEICKRLEKELKLLDEKVEEMNKDHKQEMEKYREKLWEMHKPGNTPRDVQGCLQVMVELRSRIENLENCSEKLKTEKETLENSFRFHSAEQEHMTLDLLDKMRELQEAGSEPQKGRNISHRELPQPNFDLKIVERLQDLSSQLVKQTKELEHALAERTQQICQLRWELLHRDVSTIKLETELHSAHMQGNSSQKRIKCDEKRTKYAHFRSWSSEEASKHSPQECKVTDHLRSSEFQDTYYKQSETKFQASKLTDTVHELNRELIRLSSAAESLLGGQESQQTKVAEKKDNAISSAIKSQVNNTQDSLMCSSSETSSCDTFLIRKNGVSKISVRRNSAGSISMASGREPSESSSVNDDKVKCYPILKATPKAYQNMESSTSSSDSESTQEENITQTIFNPKSVVGEELVLKQIPTKKCQNDHEIIRESSSPTKEMKQPQQGLKKRTSYKGIKTIRRYNNRLNQSALPVCSSNSNEQTHKYYTVIQSESDTAISNKCFKYSNADTSEKLKSNANTISLRTCQSADQVVTKRKINKNTKDNTNKICVLNKGTLLPICKNCTSKKVEYSRSEKSHNHPNIRKSESLTNPPNSKFELPEARRSKSMKICKQLPPSQNQDIDVKLSNFRKKNRTGKTKESLKISKKAIMSHPEHESITPTAIETVQYNILGTDIKYPHVNRTGTERTLKSDTALDAEKVGLMACPVLRQNSLGSENEGCQIKRKITKACSQPEDKEKNATSDPISVSMTESRVNNLSTFTVHLPKRKTKTLQTNSYKTKLGQCSQPTEEKVTTITNRKLFSSQKLLDNDQKLGLDTGKSKKNQNLQLDKCSLVSINANQNLDNQNSSKKLSSHAIDLPHTESSKDRTLLTNFNNTDACPEKDTLHEYQFHSNTKDKGKKILKTSNSSKEQTNNSKESKIVEDTKDSQGLHSLPATQFAKLHCQDTHSPEQSKTYSKSTSAPQLDWKKNHIKRIQEGALNVKTLIDKYNQKALESQSRTMHSSAYNSPVAVRKISAPPERNYSQTHIPCMFSSTPNSPKIVSTPPVYNPMIWKTGAFYNSMISPPASPSSRARSLALQKAKEKFISTSSITNYVPDDLSQKENRTLQQDTKTEILEKLLLTKLSEPAELENLSNETKKTDLGTQVQRFQTENVSNEKSSNRKSISSAKSIDSMSFVMYKTGETCQESRLLKRNEKQKTSSFKRKNEEPVKPLKSLSNSSIFGSIKGPDIKFPSSFLRLRRSHRKKDMITVSQLCRQSLMISGESSTTQTDQPVISKSPRSCPSSPELKSKSKAKGSWLQRNIFWHK